MHNKDLPAGTLHAILKQAGINKEELIQPSSIPSLLLFVTVSRHTYHQAG